MNKSARIAVVAVLIVAVIAVLTAKRNKPEEDAASSPSGAIGRQVPAAYKIENLTGKGLPVLIDVGAETCIPCKIMAPILEELKHQYTQVFEVHFLNLDEYPGLVSEYRIRVKPTQIFYDASGRELFRHEGFFSKEDILAKWNELGVDLSGTPSQAPTFERFTPAKVDDRPQEKVCYMCDGDIDPETLVTVQTDKGPVRLCGPHCYFIMYSCLTEDKTGFEKKVTIADWATGQAVPISEATFLSGENETTGRPWIKAFAGREAAVAERAASGGSILALESLAQKEMSHRCGFCDRACYPQDASEVIVEGGVHTWGCCSHCALGVAARTGKDIEVRERDRLTGEPVVVKTFDGKVASLEPSTAVAWFGQRQKPDGAWASAGCFHQGFFAAADNLRTWVEKNPCETGKLISIAQALADKMKLSSEQIQKACKIGECSPK
jgi:thioredoxin 1